MPSASTCPPVAGSLSAGLKLRLTDPESVASLAGAVTSARPLEVAPSGLGDRYSAQESESLPPGGLVEITKRAVESWNISRGGVRKKKRFDCATAAEAASRISLKTIGHPGS